MENDKNPADQALNGDAGASASAPAETGGTTLAQQIVSTVVFFVLTLAAVVLFLHEFAPKSYEKEMEPFLNYDSAPMQKALAPEAVRKHLDTVLGFGSRYHGQPGLAKTEAYVRQQFEKAGLTMYEQELDTAYPLTEFAEVLSADGKKLAVRIYPFMPNQLQPMFTPPQGITGKLIRLDDKVLKQRAGFADCIGLIDNSQRAPEGYGYDWVKYAQLGLKAIIVSHPDGLKGILWNNMGSMVSLNPVNYVRLAADAAIFNHINETITIRTKVAYRNTLNPTIVGHLKSGKDVTEAIVIPASLDASSLIADSSPGTVEAVPVAVQLALLDGIVHYQDDLRRDIIFVAFTSRAMAQDGLNRLLRVIGSQVDPGSRRLELIDEQKANEGALKRTQDALKLFSNEEFLISPDATRTVLAGSDEATRAFFEDQYRYVLNTAVFNLSEGLLLTKIAFEKEVHNVEREAQETSRAAADLERATKGLQVVPDDLERAGKSADQKAVKEERNAERDIAAAQRREESARQRHELARKRHDDAFDVYMAAKSKYDRAFSCAGYSVIKLLQDKQEFVEEHDVRKLVRDRLEELLRHHETQATRLGQAFKLHDLFAQYKHVTVISPELMPYEVAPPREMMSLSMGIDIEHTDQADVVKNLMDQAIQRLKLQRKIQIEFRGGRGQNKLVSSQTNSIPLESTLWSYYSYPAYSLINTRSSYKEYSSPIRIAHARGLETIRNSLKVTGETVVSVAFGNGLFKPLRKVEKYPSFYGTVFVSNVGQSIIPNYPLKHALLGCKHWAANRGFFPYVVFFTDLYGKYDYRHCATKFCFSVWEFSPDAVTYGKEGKISYMKDEGAAAQSVYKSMGLRPHQLDNPTNIVVFRACPVSLVDLTNPQTLKSYTAMELINSRSLSGFGSTNAFTGGGILTAFVKPDAYFYIKLKAGDVDNELVQTTRAFMLGTTKREALREGAADRPVRVGKEIQGEGYLAYDSPVILNTPREIAKSMLFVNSERLALQEKHHMADERTIEFHDKSKTLLEESFRKGQPADRSRLLARDAVTYATLNHPVLRKKIFEAVAGILWYLGLLVPFVFFFEKLIFGFPDIRKQIVAQLIIFLVIFSLLKILHPAFEMIRSSLMILLGFIIFLFSAAITVLFAGKFQENLEQVKKQRGQVTAAEVNTMGVIATSFMLGLNNMHRRRVRTGLTCGTLVLLTFVMICFTSIHSNIVDKTTAFGKAAYQGFLVKNEKFIPVSAAELFALETKYARKYEYLPEEQQTPSKQDHLVLPRFMLVGTEDWQTKERHNALLEMVYEGAGRSSRAYNFDSILRLSCHEPLIKNLRFLTKKSWFTKEQEEAQTGTVPLIISDAGAEKLGITPEMVDKEGVTVTLYGEKFLIQGIFDSTSLSKLAGLDGKTLLPFDIKGLINVKKQGNTVILAEDTDPLIGAEKIILAPLRNLNINVQNANEIINSIAVVLPNDLNYKEARQTIYSYLEQSGKSTYYGLDGYAFLGRRTRQSSFSGLIEMLIPLIIAALTVLNTMKGSVYERRDEIFVYNAVGIAPKYIFAMFFAEAFVYAVVGSVLGYILSQGTGRILTACNWTGGLNMTFTSKTTIYASLTIAFSVFASTYFPAKSAMQIAAPTEDVGWELPEPEGDALSFLLPFTFDYHDRIAILSFFNRYFLDHGEGSSGAFFAGQPSPGVGDRLDPLAGDSYVPALSVTIWLKPYDLGVCQELTIALPTDPETKEYIANITLTRQSGTLENWKRLNVHFISLIRKHFLYWRAVTDLERDVMFVEAKELLEEKVIS